MAAGNGKLTRRDFTAGAALTAASFLESSPVAADAMAREATLLAGAAETVVTPASTTVSLPQ